MQDISTEFVVDDWLTSKQVQQLLKVDRITIYRMIKDHRLTGAKIGQQWRFPRRQVEALLSGNGAAKSEVINLSADVLPIQCVQPAQDVFAEVAQLAAITCDPTGKPLTQISNSCRFCNLILATESGLEACITSWRKLAEHPPRVPKFALCHAGLQYAAARIEVQGNLVAMLIAGQFINGGAKLNNGVPHISALAAAHHLDQIALTETARELLTLGAHRREQIGAWLVKVASTFEHMARERVELIGRLERIADMSNIKGTSRSA